MPVQNTTFASSCIIDMGIRADRVAACILLTSQWTSNFSNAALAIAEIRARPVKTKHNQL